MIIQNDFNRDLAPIALFVYKRPAHTRQTVEALLQNPLAAKSDLIIYSDAARHEKDALAVREVRQYVNAISGFKSVTIIEQEKNLGLANSVIAGVTEVVNRYGRVIVLEDDLVTSPYFLQFMNDALKIYEHDDTVMHISGSKYPINAFGNENTYFFRVPLCWGWATWQRSWQYFRKEIAVMKKFDTVMIAEFSFHGNYHYWDQLKLNKSGKLNTWFIFWYAAMFMRGGLALFPQLSLVRNVGMDGSGVHCESTDEFVLPVSEVFVEVKRIPVMESAEAVNLHMAYFKSVHGKAHRIRNLFRRILKLLKSV